MGSILNPEPAVSDAHRAHLRTSCLSDETIDLAGLFTESDRSKLAELLKRKAYAKARGAALVFPAFLPGRDAPVAHRVRPDSPAIGKGGKPIKYDQAATKDGGPGVVVYFPPRSRRNRLRGESTVVWTEGEKKALLLDQSGFATVGLPGVSCWGDGAGGLHAWIAEHVDVAGRDHVLVFDADVATNETVRTQLGRLAHVLLAHGAKSVRAVSVPGEGKEGIDDVAHVAFKTALDEGGTEPEAFTAAEACVRELVAITNPVEVIAPSSPAKDQQGLKGAPIPGNLLWPNLGYRCADDGRIVRLQADDEGQVKEIAVMRRPVLLSRILIDADRSEHLEIALLREGTWRTERVSRGATGSSKNALDALRPLGAAIDQENAGECVKFFTCFEELNEKRIPRIRSTRQCGWYEIDGKRDFMAPDPIANSALVFDGDRDAVRGLGCGGARAAHEAVLRQALTECDESAVAVCAALAAPLVRILGLADSFAVHLRGDTSRGKSSMLAVATSVYAHPKTYIQGFDATPYYVSALAAARNDLPMVFDEVGANQRAEDLARIVYSLANGRSRGQGQRDGTVKQSQTWRTVVLTSGESSLVPDDSGPGGLRARVLNLHVRGFGELDKDGVDSLRAQCDANYGHFGHAWIDSLRKADWDKLKASHAALGRELAAGVTGMRARQSGSWAALRLAEVLAREALGLTGEGRVLSAFAAHDDHNESRATNEVALERVQEWFALQRASFPNLLREVTSGATSWRGGSVERGRETLGHVAGDELWVSPMALREFLKREGFSDRVVLPLWAEAGVIEREGGAIQVRRRVDGERRRFVVFRGSAMGLGTGACSEADEVAA